MGCGRRIDSLDHQDEIKNTEQTGACDGSHARRAWPVTLDFMNREKILECLKSIRSSIEVARDSDTRKSLHKNYVTGIRLCDEMITNVENSTGALSCESLFSKFDRYVSDCLPWNELLLGVIHTESKCIKNELKEI